MKKNRAKRGFISTSNRYHLYTMGRCPPHSALKRKTRMWRKSWQKCRQEIVERDASITQIGSYNKQWVGFFFP